MFEAAKQQEIVNQLAQASSLALDGIAYADEAEVGRAVGRRDSLLLTRMVRLTTLWALAAALGLTLVYGVAGEAIVALFTDHAPVRAEAGRHLPWLVAMPLVAVWSYQFDGIFIGLNAFRAMFLTMTGAFAAFAGVAALAVPDAGNHGLWAAMTALMAARGGLQVLCYPMLVRGKLADVPAQAAA